MDNTASIKKPKLLAKLWMRFLLACWFRVTVTGVIPTSARSLILANTTSSIDALLLALFSPQRLTIVLPAMAEISWGSRLLGLVADTLVWDCESTADSKALIAAIKAGKTLVFFPEQASFSTEKQLAIYDNLAAITQQAQATVTPLRVDGPQYTRFSANKDKYLRRWFAPVTLQYLPAIDLTGSDYFDPQQKALTYRLMLTIHELHYANRMRGQSLFSALIDGASLGARNKTTIEDANRTPLGYKQFLMRCFILGRQIKSQTKANDWVGVLMPTTTAGMVTFFALQAYRRVPAMLNFSMGFYNLYSACSTAGIKVIYTSKQFIATAKLEQLIDELLEAGLVIHYLEDFKDRIGLGNKVAGVMKNLFPRLTYKLLGHRQDPQEAALILFTSGSEGLPKAVALSHNNILANCFQMMSRVDFSSTDVFFNTLPIFHCFGLTAGSILPLVAGMKCFFYPSPLHYKIIPPLVRETKASIMFGTDTFLTGYARAAEKDDFRTLRYIFAGAEKVKPETSRYWSEVLGVRIYEGYGATETSPVISLNCPLAFKAGSVGMILPCMTYKIEPVEGIATGGRLFLRGPNIMLGYVSADNPKVIVPPNDGWHDTGDIVTLDAPGLITIVGRAKRFAKIAGEMISLTAIEGIAASIWPELLNAAIIQKAETRGERVFLFCEAEDADKTLFMRKVRELGYSDLLIPYQIIPGATIPVLPSGKIDYPTLEKNNAPSLCEA